MYQQVLKHAALPSGAGYTKTGDGTFQILKGTTNEKLVRHVRMVNPTAKIIATADVLADSQMLYAAGADYVTIARLDQANELLDVVMAAEAGLLDELRQKLDAQLEGRQEILP